MNFTEEDRLHICKSFWGLSSYERKKDFILQNIAENPTVHRRPRNENAAPRKSARSYYFRKAHQNVRVCQLFFLKTIRISNRQVIQAFNGKDKLGSHFSLTDMRGKHRPYNKTTDQAIKNV